jgi:chromosome segregation ATPase
VTKNQMDQMMVRKNQIDNELEILQKQQKQLFKETNAVTNKLDELSSRKEIYEEKISELDETENPEDYHRINEKLSPLQKEYNQLKTLRNQFMQNSKDIKEKMQQFQKNLHEVIQKITQFQPQFEKSTFEFNELNQQIESFNRQISTTQNEINRLIMTQSSPKYKKFDSNSLEKMQITKSKFQIDQELQEIHLKLNTVNNNLQDFQKKYNISLDSHSLTELEQDLKKKLNDIKALPFFMNESIADQQIAQILAHLKQFQEITNKILQSLNINIEFHLNINLKSINPIELKYFIKKNNKALANLDDFKRIEKAYFVLAIIIAFFITYQKNTIMINYHFLPDYVTTKTTFLKSIELLQSVFDSDPFFNEYFIIIFASKENLELKPTIEIKQ